MAKSVKDIPVLFENEHCMVLNKPAGLSAQGGEGVGVSLDSILSESFSPRPLLVHRLDKDTSGVILVAKSKEAAAYFSGLFAGQTGERVRASGANNKKNGSGEYSGSARGAVKRYLALCSGVPGRESGVIETELDTRSGSGRAAVQRKARTFFKCLSVYRRDDNDNADGGDVFSLMELELGTGRTHQIRRHLARIGHPVLGDDKYGDFPLNRKLKKEKGLRNMLLHAASLTLPPSRFLPDGLFIEAPVPACFSLIAG